MSANGSDVCIAPQHPEHDVLIEQEDSESSDISFEDLNLSRDLLKGVYNCGYAKPSQIQALAVPRLLRDPPEHLIAQAQSGTGKTAAFSLAILSRIDFDNPSSQAIVLSPTRELARQIVDVIKSLAKFTPASVNKVIPESVPQVGLIEGQILIGTPGKLGDMMKRRRIDVSCVKMLVLDEADCMLEFQGFLQQIEIIKK
ncbi:RNA helicase required for poly(A+) mRNA export [Mortierella sp. AD010]|nr:RNA helicase required for poly(A+) mRNA export [Mortierella sp. AD010]